MKSSLPFNKQNYKWMIIGIVTLIIGFITMSLDQEQHGFGVLGLTVGPIIIMAGFIIEIYAIFVRSEEKEISETKEVNKSTTPYKK